MSIFLELYERGCVAENELAFAIRDGFPVSPGHTLVVPKRVVTTWFDATREEQVAMLELVDAVKQQLDATSPRPAGYNVGFNVGEAAGQTVMHLHVHVIPRYEGDVDDPRGGVRFVIPEHGNYKAPGRIPRVPSSPHTTRGARFAAGGVEDPLLAHIRPALRGATHVTIVAAFVQGSGVDLLAPLLEDALRRGTSFHVLTGDYLHITQTRALRTLLQWSQGRVSLGDEGVGDFRVRVVETKALGGRAFHPKSWRFEGGARDVVWVGSSNWSKSALTAGVEWNLQLDRAEEPAGYAEVVHAFDELWRCARPLDAAWLDAYAARARDSAWRFPAGDAEDDDALPPEPRGVQPEALEALAASRAQGRTRALAVLATGLGKTFLAAFDTSAFADTLGRPPRVLFIAHRRELLLQSAETFRKVWPDASVGFFVGPSDDLHSQLVFASIQKLTLPQHLASLIPDAFDYVVVDEVHHASSPSYRRVLAHLKPAFVLGLTATPERADEADVAGLFDDHVPVRVGLAEGIDRELLARFHYVGLPDTVDYTPIPWRNRRFDTETLATAAATHARMERLLEAMQKWPGARTLVFCVSIRHCDWVADWLRERGDLRAVAVHSGDGSAPREESLDALALGSLDAVCAVDLFNEGVDVPAVDRVIMLRPTESPVVFLQQLGRGLRRTEDKERLQVIDFIGNHKVFLQRMRTLLDLGRKRPPALRDYLDKPQLLELPAGCALDVVPEAIDFLRRLLPKGSTNELVRVYRELSEARGARPSAGELYRLGYSMRSLRSSYGGWLEFVASEGGLSDAEQEAHALLGEWFRHIETTSMTKCFKMVVLSVLLERDAFFAPLPIHRLAAESHAWLARDPALFRDIEGVSALPEPRAPELSVWERYWSKNPVRAWSKGAWFVLRDDALAFRPARPASPDVEAACVALTRELVDWRLAEYRARHAAAQTSAAFTCRVSWNQRDPILFLPTTGPRDALPESWTSARLPDGTAFDFKFAKAEINIGKRPGQPNNALPDLLRRWFGPDAGTPGTRHSVRFERSPDGWWVEPMGRVVSLPARDTLVAYPSLKAAAGASGQSSAHVEAEAVRLPVHGATEAWFAVRATGDSMDGGSEPIRDGDWVVLEWARSAGLPRVEGRVALIARGDADEGQEHFLKRVVRAGGGGAGPVLLRSDNPRRPDLTMDPTTTVLALHRATLRPEDIAPPPGARLRDDELASAFGVSAPPTAPHARVDGHLFALLTDKGQLRAPNSAAVRVAGVRTAETAFVLARVGSAWRYCGVGRQRDEGWSIPEVDFATWRALGSGRSASRPLAETELAAARAFVAEFLRSHPSGTPIETSRGLAYVRGQAARGGMRIDGGAGAFRERTLSLVDLAWVLVAARKAEERGAVLDEAWVNRCRYLEGTPKASTRWIDTGWALALVRAASES